MSDAATQGAWSYLHGLEPAADAPLSDNHSGLYCPACRASGAFHCAHPEWCGGMQPMRSLPTQSPLMENGHE